MDDVIGSIVALFSHQIAENRGKVPYECHVAFRREGPEDDAIVAGVLEKLAGPIKRERFVPTVNMTEDRAQIVLTRDPDGVFANG